MPGSGQALKARALGPCVLARGGAGELQWAGEGDEVGPCRGGGEGRGPGHGRAAAAFGRSFSRWRDTARRSTREASLRTCVERLRRENAALKSDLQGLSHRVEQLESAQNAELDDYLRREQALLEFAQALPAPPEYGTDDPSEIARREGERIGVERLQELFTED